MVWPGLILGILGARVTANGGIEGGRVGETGNGGRCSSDASATADILSHHRFAVLDC